MVKKGAMFTLEAFIAVILLMSALALLVHHYSNKEVNYHTTQYSSDIMQILSTVRLSELNAETLAFLSNNNITDLNKTIVEQVLRFQVGNEEANAEELLELTLSNVIPNNYHLGVWIEGYNESIYVTSSENASNIIATKQMVSGIERNRTIEGITARALLSNINQRANSEIVYFGGYEGDGNITKIINLPSNVDEINYVEIEANMGGGFNLYINDNFAGNYSPTDIQGADTWTINSSYKDYLQSGENEVLFNFNSDNRFVGGGYLKVDYQTDELSTYNDVGEGQYNMPGIDGIINLYSSFFIPGTLNNLSIYLHYQSENEVFINIGDRTVYSQNSSGETEITIPNSELDQLLNYNDYSNKTVPIRIGLRNVSYSFFGFGGTADSVLVTDVSGSMDDCVEYTEPYICEYNCWWGGAKSCEVSDPDDCSNTVCGGSCWFDYGYGIECTNTKMDIAKTADKEFVDVVLETENNRVGLVSYDSSTDDTEGLTNSTSTLYNVIDSYSPGGSTCICCGVISATSILTSESNSSRARSMLVMTDGEANVDCNLDPVTDHDEDGDTSDDPQDHAIEAACDAYNNYNITVYTVGFGDISYSAQQTLNSMSECGGGNYVYTNLTNLTTIYQGIAAEIVNFSYSAQTVESLIDVVNTTLFPDSYINYSYTPALDTEEYGRIPITIETPTFGNNISEGNFTIPENMIVYEAKITSYSGDKWTDRAAVKDGSWNYFYNLSTYNSDYQNLGDPYTVNIPVELLSSGENQIYISTGLNGDNSTGGSVDNKIIYTGGIEIGVNYTGVFSTAEGCLWHVEFDDNTTTDLPLPSYYSGSNECTYEEDTICSEFNVDAVQNAVCHLLSQLDPDGDGKLFVKFGPEDLDIETSSIGQVPFLWGPTLVEVRVWQ
jgi:hypothetical protein